jgi:hypothetical protein
MTAIKGATFDRMRARAHAQRVNCWRGRWRTYDDRRSAVEQFLAWYETRASDLANYDEYPAVPCRDQDDRLVQLAFQRPIDAFDKRLSAEGLADITDCSGAKDP